MQAAINVQSWHINALSYHHDIQVWSLLYSPSRSKPVGAGNHQEVIFWGRHIPPTCMYLHILLLVFPTPMIFSSPRAVLLLQVLQWNQLLQVLQWNQLLILPPPRDGLPIAPKPNLRKPLEHEPGHTMGETLRIAQELPCSFEEVSNRNKDWRKQGNA